MLPHNRFKVLTGLMLLVSFPLVADDTRQGEEVYLQIAQTLLADFPQADSMALEHARNLLDGIPVKRWKNCWMKNTLQQEQLRVQSSAVLTPE